jgi:methyl-accepting chemotaxis protein
VADDSAAMRLTVRTKLLGGFLAVVALMVLLGVLALLTMGSLNGNTAYIGKKTVPSVVLIARVQSELKQYRLDQLQYTLSTDVAAQASLDEERKKVGADVTAELSKYAPLVADGKDRALWQAEKDEWAAYQHKTLYYTDAIGDEAKQAFAGLLSVSDRWTGYNIQLSDRQLRGSRSSYAFSKWLVVGLLVGSALAGLAIAFVIARGITRGVGQMLVAARGIAEGDVEQNVVVRSRDELGETAGAFQSMVVYLKGMAQAAERIAAGDLTVAVVPRSERDVLGSAFARMTGSLGAMIGELARAATTMGSASQEMAASSQEAGRAVAEIARAVGGVAAGAERQVRMVEQAKGSTEETSVAAEQAQTLAQSGVAAAEQVHAAMGSLRDSTLEVSGAIGQLATRSEQISGIVDTITGIAGQTNLLALNAAIEAARAGEQGRGFAVVAEEVRKLAEESQRAAASISGLIGEIQAETVRTVRAVEQGAQQTEQSSSTVEAARQAFHQIGASVEDIRARISQIVEATTEVAAVAEQSSASMEQVSASTEHTSSSAQQISSSAQELATTAEELQRLIGHFKTAD